MADPQLRHIPEQLLEFGMKLKQAGFSGSKISQALESEAFQRDIRITWTRKDVYNNFASKPGERYLDATNFVEFLQKRYNQNDLFFEVMTDSDGCLVNAFWILIEALHRWSDNFSNNVLLFDTSHATNKYGLKFGPLITIDSNGRTIIFACSLLTTETERAFAWVFSTLEKAFHHTPKVIITNGKSHRSGDDHRPLDKPFLYNVSTVYRISLNSSPPRIIAPKVVNKISSSPPRITIYIEIVHHSDY